MKYVKVCFCDPAVSDRYSSDVLSTTGIYEWINNGGDGYAATTAWNFNFEDVGTKKKFAFLDTMHGDYVKFSIVDAGDDRNVLERKRKKFRPLKLAGGDSPGTVPASTAHSGREKAEMKKQSRARKTLGQAASRHAMLMLKEHQNVRFTHKRKQSTQSVSAPVPVKINKITKSAGTSENLEPSRKTIIRQDSPESQSFGEAGTAFSSDLEAEKMAEVKHFESASAHLFHRNLKNSRSVQSNVVAHRGKKDDTLTAAFIPATGTKSDQRVKGVSTTEDCQNTLLHLPRPMEYTNSSNSPVTTKNAETDNNLTQRAHTAVQRLASYTASDQNQANVATPEANVRENYALVPSHVQRTAILLDGDGPTVDHNYVVQQATYLDVQSATPHVPLQDLTNRQKPSPLSSTFHPTQQSTPKENVQTSTNILSSNTRTSEQPVASWGNQYGHQSSFELTNRQQGGIWNPYVDEFYSTSNSQMDWSPSIDARNVPQSTTYNSGYGEDQDMSPGMQHVMQAIKELKESISQLQSSVNEIRDRYESFQPDQNVEETHHGGRQPEEGWRRQIVVSALPPMPEPCEGEVEFSEDNFLKAAKYRYLNGRLTFICRVLYGQSNLHKYYTTFQGIPGSIVLDPSVLIGIQLLMARLTKYRNAITVRSNVAPEKELSVDRLISGLSKIFSRARKQIKLHQFHLMHADKVSPPTLNIVGKEGNAENPPVNPLVNEGHVEN